MVSDAQYVFPGGEEVDGVEEQQQVRSSPGERERPGGPSLLLTVRQACQAYIPGRWWRRGPRGLGPETALGGKGQ